jgi:hypothetical protein
MKLGMKVIQQEATQSLWFFTAIGNTNMVTEESHKKPYDSQSADQDMNPGPLEYKAGILTTW